MAPQKYYFARLNLLPLRGFEEKRQLLIDALQSGVAVEDHQVLWRIFNVGVVQTDVGEFLTGYVAKYRKESSIEIAVPERQLIDIQTVENLISARSIFFLHIKSGLMAYHVVPKLLPDALFKSRFSQLLYNGVGFFIDVEIDPIQEQFRLTSEIKRFDKIIEVKIQLHPSNPSNREIWKRQDQRLKRLRATSYREQYEARGETTPGLLVMADRDIRSKIAMAEDGYGTAVVLGQIKGEQHEIKTSDNPVTARAPGHPEPLKYILRTLQPVFERIMKRFK